MKRFMTLWAIAGMVMLGLPSPLWAAGDVLGTNTDPVENQVTDGKPTAAQKQVANQALIQQAVQNNWRSRRADKVGLAVAAPAAQAAVPGAQPVARAAMPAQAMEPQAQPADWQEMIGGVPSNFVEENFEGAFGRFIRENWGDPSPTKKSLRGTLARKAQATIRPNLEGLIHAMSIFGGIQIGKSNGSSKDIVVIFKGVLPTWLRPPGEAPTYYGSLTVVIEKATINSINVHVGPLSFYRVRDGGLLTAEELKWKGQEVLWWDSARRYIKVAADLLLGPWRVISGLYVGGGNLPPGIRPRPSR